MQQPMNIINPLNYPDWNNLVTASKDYSFFHSSNWARVLHESYDYKPLYFAVPEDGRLRTLIPVMEVRSHLTGKRGVSLPFTDYCEPIMEKGDSTWADLQYLVEYGKRAGWKYIDLRGEKYFSEDIPSMSSFYVHVLPLGEESRIVSGIHKHYWRDIKAAGKKGVVAEVSTTLESLKEFYNLHCMTRKMHGVPPQSFSYFTKIHENIISKNLGSVILASYDGKYIAGAVFFHFGDQSVYKYSASDRKFRTLCGNYIVLWEAIKLYAAKGCKTLCFGRTDMGEEGLRKFKSGWGTEERIVKYFRYNLVTGKFAGNGSPQNETIRQIFRKLPVPLLKMTGTLLYRHMG